MKKLLTFISNNSVLITVSILLIMSIALMALILIGSDFSKDSFAITFSSIAVSVMAGLLANSYLSKRAANKKDGN